MARRRLALAALWLVACGPGMPRSDGGGEIDAADAMDAGIDASDASVTIDVGDPCAEEEGTFECGGVPRQCCGGEWRSFSDGPCWVRDGGGFDGGPTDCATTPLEPGCPCAEEGADMCRPFRTTLRCTSGVWSVRLGISCCAF